MKTYLDGLFDNLLTKNFHCDDKSLAFLSYNVPILHVGH